MITGSSGPARALLNPGDSSVSRLWQRTARHAATALRWLIALILLQVNALAFSPTSAASSLAAPSAHEKWRILELQGQTVRWLAVAPANPQKVYAAVTGPAVKGVYYSPDGGSTWSSLGLGNHTLQTLTVCPSGAVFAGTWGDGVFRLDGSSWTQTNNGLGDPYVTVLGCDAQNTLFAGTSVGFRRSTNSGGSWSDSSTGLPRGVGGYVLALGWRSGSVYAGTQQGVYKSVDGGLNWSSSGLAGQKIYDLDFDATNPAHIWAASLTQGTHLSTNGGATWVSLGGPLETYTVQHDAIGDLYTGTVQTGAYRYAGSQWTQQLLDASRVYHLRRAGSGAGHLLAATTNGIWMPLPDIRLTLDADAPNRATVGAQITYYIDYQTNGNGIMSGVVITNPIPEGAELVEGSMQPSGSVSGNVVRWNLGNLGPDPKSGTLSYKVLVKVPAGAAVATAAESSSPEAAVEPDTAGAEAQPAGPLAEEPEPDASATPAEGDLGTTMAAESPSEADLSPSPAPSAVPSVVGSAEGGDVLLQTTQEPSQSEAPLNQGQPIPEPPLELDLEGQAATQTLTTGEAIERGSVISNATSKSSAEPVLRAASVVTGTIKPGSGQPAGPAAAILSLDKTVTESTYNKAGDILHYVFKLTNSSTAGETIIGPFTVADDKATDESCPETPSSLVLGEFTTCTATYTVLAMDIINRSVTNTATAAADNGGSPVTSVPDSVTVYYASMSLNKSANPTTFKQAGDIINYTIVATNNGQATLSNVNVTDPKLGTLSCTWPGTAGILTPNQAVSCTGSYTILAADVTAGFFTNTATVASDQAATVQALATVNAVKISLTKTASPATYNALNQTITYNYVIKNTGNVSIGPAQFKVSDDHIGSPLSTPFNCGSTTTLAPNATVGCTATYTIKQADLNAGSVTNHATASGGGVTSSQATATVNLARLALNKSANPTTFKQAGDIINYTIVATNNGQATLSNVNVTDPKLGTLSCTWPGTAGILTPNQAVSCTGSYTILAADVTAGFFTNTATATSDLAATVQALATVNLARLALTKTASPATYNALDQTITYNYVIKNTGSATIGPAQFKVSDDHIGSPLGTPFNCGSTTTLAPNATVGCTATYKITQADLNFGSVTNHATASGGGATSTQATATVNAVQTKAVTIVKRTNGQHSNSPPGPSLSVGSAVQWTYTVANTGNVTLSSISVTDDKGVAVTCPKTTLQPLEAMDCTAAGTTVLGQYSNIGTVTAFPPTGAAISASDPSYYFGVTPDLTLTKTDNEINTSPGATLVYNLSYQNNGTQDATGVILTETVPAHTTFNAASSTSGWTCVPNNNAGSTCTKGIGDVLAGAAAASVSFAVTVDFPLAFGTMIENTASVSDSLGNTGLGSDSTQVGPGPRVFILNQGASATWQYGGSTYGSESNILAYGIPVFLPFVMKR